MDLDSPKEGQDYSLHRFKEWKLSELKDAIGRWQKYKREEGYWNAVFTENHDRARAVSRFGNDSEEWRALSAKMLAILQVTQSGTQFVYQGQELGLKNFPRSWGIEEYKDIASQNFWNRILEKRKKEEGNDQEVDMSDILDDFQKKARDHARVPMQWDATRNAGFTTGDPWMRVNEDYPTWNATAQISDDKSVRSFWKKALSIRKQYDVLIYGDFEDISEGHTQVFGYTRTLGTSKILVVLNFKEKELDFRLEINEGWTRLKLILGNYDVKEEVLIQAHSTLRLKAYEGRIYVTS